jgi:arylsulfatase A-like enzyme
MTYNFDPDKWYQNERGMLDSRFKTGEINEQEYKDAVSELDRRYDEMLERLDGTYQLPK